MMNVSYEPLIRIKHNSIGRDLISYHFCFKSILQYANPTQSLATRLTASDAYVSHRRLGRSP